jgi:outer membrane protein OmpA-like peptidoglycan-associated protein
MSPTRDCPHLTRFLLLFALFACPFAARAVELDLKLEPGVAFPVGSPQSDRFGVGGAASLKGLVGFERSWVSLTAGLTFIGLSSQSGYESTDAGTAWAPSLGLRLQSPRETEAQRLTLPHEDEWFYGVKPWIDADLAYVRTGGLDRAGFAAAVGASFPIDTARMFWLGPFVRFFQIFQAGKADFDSNDSRTIIVGLSLETGTRVMRPYAPKPIEEVLAAPPPVAVATVAPACIPIPDRDGDGVPDDVDACPDVWGPPSNGGCPVYEKVVVKPDKLELKEKIQFEWDTAKLDPVSHPLLNEVAQALKDNKKFRVTIEGHASSEGTEPHNQTLSEERGAAVLEFLVKAGVARDRLVSKGFSSSQPIQSNATEAGREANRRVEFIVHLIIVKEGSAQ